MNKVNNILKENKELKDELDDMLGLVKENEIKYKGFKVIEYAFLLAENLQDYQMKPLKYLEEIFSIDKAVLFINNDHFNQEIFNNNGDPENISFTSGKTFKYFYLEKRPYCDSNKTNMIKEFDLLPDMGSYLFSPIMENSQIAGSLNLYSYNKTRFDSEKSFDFIKDLSFKISVSLRKMYNSHLIFQQSRIDNLSNIFNKTALYEQMEKYINKYQRYGDTFLFCLFDIDNFKKINDTLGHLEGDNFIQEIGKKLKNEFRKSDITGRFGGDEFYIITPHSEISTQEDIKGKISSIIYDTGKNINMENVIGVSSGFVNIKDLTDNDEKLTAESIIEMADNRLYDDKNLRNTEAL